MGFTHEILVEIWGLSLLNQRNNRLKAADLECTNSHTSKSRVMLKFGSVGYIEL